MSSAGEMEGFIFDLTFILVNSHNQLSFKRTRCYRVVLLILFLPPFGYAQQPLPGIISRFIVIGDAGKLRDGKNVVVEAATRYIAITDSITTVLFLGDNI